jgi:site-specific recombinase XerD
MEDIDFDDRSIVVTEKGNKTRVVFFGENVKRELLYWIRHRREIMGTNDGPLFVSNRKKRISVCAVQDILKKYTAGFDKHITPHKMRSTCATNLYEETHDIYLVQNVLGHSNIANTRRYADMSEEYRRDAASIIDF